MSMSTDADHRFTLAENSYYLSAVIKAIQELDQESHSAESFLDSVQSHLEYWYQVGQRVSASTGDDTSEINRENIERFHQAVCWQVLRDISRGS